MKLSAALDTSSTKTAICVVNSRDGTVVFEASVATDPEIIFEALAPYLPRLDTVGQSMDVPVWMRRDVSPKCAPTVLDLLNLCATCSPSRRREAGRTPPTGAPALQMSRAEPAVRPSIRIPSGTV